MIKVGVVRARSFVGVVRFDRRVVPVPDTRGDPDRRGERNDNASTQQNDSVREA